MKTRTTIPMTVVVALAVSLAGCDKSTMPKVNEENCTFENIKKIDDPTTRQKFARLCGVDPRAGEYKFSKPRKW